MVGDEKQVVGDEKTKGLIKITVGVLPRTATEDVHLSSSELCVQSVESVDAHEDPDFVPIIVHEEVVDLVEVVRLLDEHDRVLLFETRSLHSTFEYFFCHNRPGTRVFESLLDNQRESALFVVPEES